MPVPVALGLSSRRLRQLGSHRLEHERLLDGCHAHPLGDELAQAKACRRGGAGGHGVMVGAAGLQAQFCSWRPVRQASLLGSLLAWVCYGCSQSGSGCGCAAPDPLPAEKAGQASNFDQAAGSSDDKKHTGS
jgi:hypothetical protein